MPQIVTLAHFNKNNGLSIPLAVENPTASVSTASPNSAGAITSLCVEIERMLLIGALGVVLYNELQTALANLDDVANAKWKKMVNGDDFDGKSWKGLKHDLTFIAQRIFETYTTANNDYLTSLGVQKVKGEKSTAVSPAYKIANANHAFIKNYQGGFLTYPDMYNCNGFDVVDYYGYNDDVDVSFYQYLIAKQADFPTWNVSMFRVYSSNEIKNSFGI